MTSRDFCYWLQGFLELTEDNPEKIATALSTGQVACLKKHLAMVFEHEIDPTFGDKKKQDVLNQLHNTPSGDLIMRC